MINTNLDYWGYMHGKSRETIEDEEEPYLTLNEVFELDDTIIKGIIGTDTLKLVVINRNDLLVIQEDGTYKNITKLYTLRTIAKGKFYTF